jgi:hypothetical protein
VKTEDCAAGFERRGVVVITTGLERIGRTVLCQLQRFLPGLVDAPDVRPGGPVQHVGRSEAFGLSGLTSAPGSHGSLTEGGRTRCLHRA